MTLRASTGKPLRTLPGILVILLLLSLGLAGCAGTRVDTSHPLASQSSSPAASVYFIRPLTERYMGFADNVLTIEAEETELLRLVKGEYTLATLKPGTVRLTARSDTNRGPEFKYQEMTRSREFSFRPGQTYFIVLKPFDGEFRGVHFEFDAVELADAKALSRHLRVKGAARSRPISKL